jgi:hypothetical protein
LGVEPALGRLFNFEEDRAFGPSPYAVLSYDYWRARFSSSPAVIGQKLRVNGYPFTVIGVARRGFHSTDVSIGPDLYLPATMRSEVTRNVLAIRTARSTAGLVDAARRQVTATDPTVPMLTARTIEQQIDNNILEDRLLMTLTGFFGSLALLLAAVGLYGVDLVRGHAADSRDRNSDGVGSGAQVGGLAGGVWTDAPRAVIFVWCEAAGCQHYGGRKPDASGRFGQPGAYLARDSRRSDGGVSSRLTVAGASLLDADLVEVG